MQGKIVLALLAVAMLATVAYAARIEYFEDFKCSNPTFLFDTDDVGENYCFIPRGPQTSVRSDLNIIRAKITCAGSSYSAQWFNDTGCSDSGVVGSVFGVGSYCNNVTAGEFLDLWQDLFQVAIHCSAATGLIATTATILGAIFVSLVMQH